MAFHCANVSGNSFLKACEHSGICSENEVFGEFCLCTEGYEHDMVGFGHLYNCSLPSNALMVFFIIYTVLFSFGSVLSLRQLSKAGNGVLKSLLKLSLAWCLSAYINVLSVFLQNGYYEAAIVTFAIEVILGYSVAAFAIRIVFVPILKRTSKTKSTCFHSLRLQYFPWYVTLAQSLFSIVANGIELKYCRDLNPAYFNYLGSIQATEQALAVITSTIFIFMGSMYLKSILPKKFVRLQKQLSLIIFFAFFLGFCCCILLIAFISWNVQNTNSFLWISWMLTESTLVVGLFLTVPLFATLSKTDGTNPTSSQNKRKTDNSGEIRENGEDQDEFSGQNYPAALGIIRSKYRRKNRFKHFSKFLSRITENEEPPETLMSQRVGSQFPSLLDTPSSSGKPE